MNKSSYTAKKRPNEPPNVHFRCCRAHVLYLWKTGKVTHLLVSQTCSRLEAERKDLSLLVRVKYVPHPSDGPGALLEPRRRLPTAPPISQMLLLRLWTGRQTRAWHYKHLTSVRAWEQLALGASESPHCLILTSHTLLPVCVRVLVLHVQTHTEANY